MTFIDSTLDSITNYVPKRTRKVTVDPDADLGRFIDEYGSIMSFPVASDSGQNTFRNWLDNSPRKDRLPTVFLVDAKGMIQWIGAPGQELNGLLEDFVKGRFHHVLTPFGEELQKAAKKSRREKDWQDAKNHYNKMQIGWDCLCCE